MRSTLSVFFVELIYNEVVAYQKNNEAINGPAQWIFAAKSHVELM